MEHERLRVVQAQLAYSLASVSLQVANLYGDALIAQKQVASLEEQISANDTLLQKALILEQVGLRHR